MIPPPSLSFCGAVLESRRGGTVMPSLSALFTYTAFEFLDGLVCNSPEWLLRRHPGNLQAGTSTKIALPLFAAGGRASPHAPLLDLPLWLHPAGSPVLAEEVNTFIPRVCVHARVCGASVGGKAGLGVS